MLRKLKKRDHLGNVGVEYNVEHHQGYAKYIHPSSDIGREEEKSLENFV
jgi:hypothetical protein